MRKQNNKKPVRVRKDQVREDKPLPAAALNALAEKVANVYRRHPEVATKRLLAKFFSRPSGDAPFSWVIPRFHSKKLTERMSIRLTLKDRLMLKIASILSGESESDIVIKRAFSRSLNVERLAKYRRQDIDYRAVQRTLSQFGNNFNQLVRAVNRQSPGLTQEMLLCSLLSFDAALSALTLQLAETHGDKSADDTSEAMSPDDILAQMDVIFGGDDDD